MEDLRLRVKAICDGDSSSASTTIRGLIKESKHDVTLHQWGLKEEEFEDTDIVYIHYGALLSRSENLRRQLKEHRETKWIAGIRGVGNFLKFSKKWEFPPRQGFADFVYELDALSVANKRFYQIVMEADSSLDPYICHCGVDTDMFQPTPLPEEFCIGWAGNPYTGAKGFFGHFLKLPFPKKTAAWDCGTGRIYKKMPAFFASLWGYVSTSVEEGCPLPPLEAAASGRVVAATACGCLPEWVPKEYLVPNVKTSVELLTPIISQFVGNREFATKEGLRFRKIIESGWSFKIIAKEYDRMFEDVFNAG